MDPIANFAASLVQPGSTIISSTSTPKTIKVTSGEGAFFPGGDGTTQFYVVGGPAGVPFDAAHADQLEFVRVTRSGDTLTTAGRGQLGTTSLATWVAGWRVMAPIHTGHFTDLLTAIAAATDTRLAKTTQKQVVATTGETDLLNGEFTVKAGWLGTTRRGILRASGSGINNSGATQANPRWKLKLGGTTLIDSNVVANFLAAAAGRYMWKLEAWIQSAGAANAQYVTFHLVGTSQNSSGGQAACTVGTGYWAPMTSSNFAGFICLAENPTAVDTTADRLLELTVTHPVNHANYDVVLDQAEFVVVNT